MTGHIRKHQKLLWYFISAAVIISFVAYFNPSSRLEQAGGGGNYGSIDGRPLSRNELVAADRLARLGGYLRSSRRGPRIWALRSGMRPSPRGSG
jgi:hypothetical protein